MFCQMLREMSSNFALGSNTVQKTFGLQNFPIDAHFRLFLGYKNPPHLLFWVLLSPEKDYILNEI